MKDFNKRWKIWGAGKTAEYELGKTADLENEKKQPILKTRQNCQFWKRDKTTDFEKYTQPLILRLDKTAVFCVR